MGDLTTDLFISVDGYAAADGVGPYFGYGGPELDAWIHAQLDEPQLVVFGRVTYEMFAPTSPQAPDRASRRLTDMPKAVVSSTLSEPLTWENTRLVTGDAVQTLPALKAESEAPLRTIGSVSLVHSLLAAGLVDRLRLMVFPLICGDVGSERILGDGEIARLQLGGTRVLDGRVVLLEYLAPGAGQRA